MTESTEYWFNVAAMIQIIHIRATHVFFDLVQTRFGKSHPLMKSLKINMVCEIADFGPVKSVLTDIMYSEHKYPKRALTHAGIERNIVSFLINGSDLLKQYNRLYCDYKLLLIACFNPNVAQWPIIMGVI